VAGTILVTILTARFCYLVVRYHGADGSVRRPHIESAALLLGIVGLIVRFVTDVGSASGRETPPRPTGRKAPPYAVWLGLVAGSLALYWPALHIGLLSDDFILFQHPLAWDVSQVAPQLFRPLPLFVWANLLHLGGGPATLHLLNIVLHGTNAYLVGRVVGGWVPGRWWPTIASWLFLAAPLGPEAVAWCAGTFDLFATMWMLCAVLVARRPTPTLRDRALLVAASIAALLSKETAVMLPVLLVIDGAIRRSLTRRSVFAIAMVTALAVAFGTIRVQSATVVEASGFSRYRVQRLLFDSFGALGAPWHVGDAWLTVIRPGYALCVIVLVSVFFINRGRRWASLAVAGGSAWVLASILLLLAFFHVGSQLEGARYLYLAVCGWSAVLVAAAADISSGRPRAEPATWAVLALLVCAGVWGVRQHLEPWAHAAASRNSVLAIAAADQRLRTCPVAYIEGLPDSVEGAYLFANGAREALADVGVTAFARAGSGDCAFRWDPAAARFAPASAPVR
jgi:hypothetical protein